MNLNDIFQDYEDPTSMPFSALTKLRDEYGRSNKEAQNMLAPYEHRAFAREYIQENPLMSIPMATMMVPGYQLSKLFPSISGNKSRSSPGLNQMGQEYMGILEGLGGWINTLFNK